MKKQLLFVLLCVVTMVACSQDELSTVTIESRSTLSASVESVTDGTRAGMESDGSFFWQEGDKIGVLMTSNKVRPMTLVKGDGGKSSGSFTTTTSETFGKYAIYPYSKDKNSVDANGNLTITFPAEYNYGSVIGEKENSFGFAMWGQIVNDSVAFKHLGGVFKIYVHNLPVGDGMQFTFSTTGKKLTGEFTTTLTSTEPMLETSNDDVNDTVTITFNNSVENGTAVFYIPTPVGTYPEIDVVITDAEGEEIAFGYWENQTVKRRAQKKGEIGEKTITGGEEGSTTIPATGGELVGEHTLTADITLEQPFIVPAGKEAIVNLNSHNITNTSDSDIEYFDIFYVEEGATLTINGEGNVEAVSGVEGYCVFAEGNVTINGGTYKSGIDAVDATNACIYARGNGNITINGGEFESADGSYVLNLKDADRATASITVYGGKFYNFDPANNISENPVQSFVAEGYASVKTSDEVYEVVPLDEAYNMPNAVITLAAGTYTLPTEFAEGVTLNCQEGVIFEGQSSLDINGAKIVGAKFANTDEKGKVATGVINGEFVDCVFEGDYALRNMKLGEKASFDGCEFIGLVYGVHFDGATTTNTELVFNDCDFTGWNSFGTAITKVTMTGCRFHHSGDEGYGRLRFYQNAVVENSTFDERYDGIDFGDLGNGQGGLESTFTGCAWTNKNIVDLFVFTGLDTVIIDGETYPVVATTADAVVEALANGDVVANATISVASELDGQGNTLFVDNELTSNHIVTASNDATIKNLNIEGGNIRTTNNKATYALYFTGGNIVVDNVSVDEVAYTINYQRTSTTASEFTLTVSNSTLTGWTSWGTIDWAKFNNVHFGIGTYYEKGSLFCGGMRPYAPTTLENCTFDKNFYISTTELSDSVTITMKNCKVDGVVLTKDNWQSYLKVEGENTAFVLFE